MLGAVSFLHRFGSALNPHFHFHVVILDGLFAEGEAVTFHHAVVSDFGIARLVDLAGGAKRLTETGMSMGTPLYMSPEQARGDAALDGRSDIYSLACVAYEMLGGAPPFSGPTPMALMARHSMDPVPSLRTIRQAVSEGVQQAIEKALVKVPADRYATAAQFASALERGVTTGAAPATRRRWSSRRTVAAAAGALALSVALGAYVWRSAWLAGKSIAVGKVAAELGRRRGSRAHGFARWPVDRVRVAGRRLPAQRGRQRAGQPDAQHAVVRRRARVLARPSGSSRSRAGRRGDWPMRASHPPGRPTAGRFSTSPSISASRTACGSASSGASTSRAARSAW